MSTQKQNISTQKQNIQLLQKQNDNIYSSLINKGINFNKEIIPSDITDDEVLKLLQDENTKLKDIAKQNKPPPQIKEHKPSPQIKEHTVKTQYTETTQINTNIDCADSDQDDNYSEPVKKFECITNMEEIKRAFFNKNYENFNTEVKNKFPLYSATYNHSSDYDGSAEYIAKNLVTGFIRNLEDYRKYLMVCFRCYKINSENNSAKYKYKSLWIVNTKEQLNNLIGSFYDDFEFTKVDESEINTFLESIKHEDNEKQPQLLLEKYLH